MPNIIVPSAIPLVQVGGYQFTDVQNLIVLQGLCNGAANGNSTCRLRGGAAGYQVPVGRTFQLYAVRAYVSTAGASVIIGQTDNDCGVATGTAFVGAVYPGSSVNLANPFNAGTATVVSPMENFFRFDVAATKFVSISNNAGTLVAAVQLFGYTV